MTDKQILEDMNEQEGFFTIEEIIEDYKGISGDYNDDFTYLVRWLFDLEAVGKIYRIRHNQHDYYITPENFSKIIREQKLYKLLGLQAI